MPSTLRYACGRIAVALLLLKVVSASSGLDLFPVSGSSMQQQLDAAVLSAARLTDHPSGHTLGSLSSQQVTSERVRKSVSAANSASHEQDLDSSSKTGQFSRVVTRRYLRAQDSKSSTGIAPAAELGVQKSGLAVNSSRSVQNVTALEGATQPGATSTAATNLSEGKKTSDNTLQQPGGLGLPEDSGVNITQTLLELSAELQDSLSRLQDMQPRPGLNSTDVTQQEGVGLGRQQVADASGALQPQGGSNLQAGGADAGNQAVEQISPSNSTSNATDTASQASQQATSFQGPSSTATPLPPASGIGASLMDAVNASGPPPPPSPGAPLQTLQQRLSNLATTLDDINTRVRASSGALQSGKGLGMPDIKALTTAMNLLIRQDPLGLFSADTSTDFKLGGNTRRRRPIMQLVQEITQNMKKMFGPTLKSAIIDLTSTPGVAGLPQQPKFPAALQAQLPGLKP